MEEKFCTHCNESRPANEKYFPRVKSPKSLTGWRLDSWCRACYARHTREYNAKHPDERRSRDQAYRERTIELRREHERVRGREYNQREAVKESRRKHHQNLKRDALVAYSTRREISCECCNENQIEFLTLDHRDNNGKQHREELGKKNGARFYKHLKDLFYPKELNLQVLCMNCNVARHWSPDKKCPHELACQVLTQGTVRTNHAAQQQPELSRAVRGGSK